MNPELPKSISDGKFFVVGYGESYQGKLVSGSEIYPTLMEWIFGPHWAEDCNDDEKQLYWDELCDTDRYWNSDQDFGPTIWRTDLGETDHIEIFRITES